MKNVIFHHNDMDGYTSAVIVNAYKPDKTHSKYVECNYKDSMPTADKIMEGDTVYIVDLSMNGSNLTDLMKLCIKAKKVIWIDHHKTSIEFYEKYHELFKNLGFTAYLNTKYCGAVLSYYAIVYNTSNVDNEETMPMFLKYVDSWDCWKHNIPNTIEFKYGIDSEVWDLEDPNSIFNILVNRQIKHPDGNLIIDTIISNGRIIKNYLDKDMATNLRNNSYEVGFLGYTCLAINSNKRTSLLFGDFINKYPVCIVWTKKKDIYSYSLYSADKSIDCSKLAEKYNGGGHPGAAGFTTNKYVLTDIC